MGTYIVSSKGSLSTIGFIHFKLVITMNKQKVEKLVFIKSGLKTFNDYKKVEKDEANDSEEDKKTQMGNLSITIMIQSLEKKVDIVYTSPCF